MSWMPIDGIMAAVWWIAYFVGCAVAGGVAGAALARRRDAG